MKPFALVALLLLSGCVSPNEDQTGVEGPWYGSIEGVLLTERFMPIAGAEVLLTHSHQASTTNAAGEFFFENLDPGLYKPLLHLEGFEAKIEPVYVGENEQATTDIIAREIRPLEPSLITQQYSVFIGCGLTVIYTDSFDCTLDESGDSSRREFITDYSHISNVTHFISETSVSKEGRYQIDIWDKEAPNPRDGMFANKVFDGTHAKIHLVHGETNTDSADSYENAPWTNQGGFSTQLIPYGSFADETTLPPLEATTKGGIGIHLGIKGKFIHSLFIHEPEKPLDTYCVLC